MTNTRQQPSPTWLLITKTRLTILITSDKHTNHIPQVDWLCCLMMADEHLQQRTQPRYQSHPQPINSSTVPGCYQGHDTTLNRPSLFETNHFGSAPFMHTSNSLLLVGRHQTKSPFAMIDQCEQRGNNMEYHHYNKH